MAKEIERKFLVRSENYKSRSIESRRIVQGYLSDNAEATVRVRIAGSQAWLTVKSINKGAERGEWEYEVPVADAEEMLRLSVTPVLSKTRHIIDHEGFRWEVDEFHGALEGLVVAEVELDDAEACPPLPDFIGREVTGDARYYNSVLAGGGEMPPSA
ncbi:MAG: CYTH domain-containing protein [Bacteroidales bacterium]|nr:CYTH domain-containing protein [Bacteroidales bacterium]